MTFSWLVNAPTPIKIIIFFGVWMGLWMPIAVMIAIALNWRPPHPLNETQKLGLLAPLYGIAPIVLWKISQVQGQSFWDYGLNWRSPFFKSTAIGFGLAIISLTLLFGFQFVLGGRHWLPKDSKPTDKQSSTLNSDLTPINRGIKLGKKVSILLPILLMALWVSSTEELIFRGFLQKQLQPDYSWFVAATVASLIFAFSHLLWEVRNTLPQLPGLALMG
ncbi:MAG TPA: CPBP family intramembrane metalloprotease domain-containing protein, partial [Oscillatoriales bacterium UBA8482]|nr:CPBP family intramembrane metalloprotease domain-containing protein [Oscillatoriales bacterium UBA8482]